MTWHRRGGGRPLAKPIWATPAAPPATAPLSDRTPGVPRQSVTRQPGNQATRYLGYLVYCLVVGVLECEVKADAVRRRGGRRPV